MHSCSFSRMCPTCAPSRRETGTLGTGGGINNNAPPMLQLQLPLSAALLFRDVNLLITTDVHSWLAGHAHPDHTPRLDADFTAKDGGADGSRLPRDSSAEARSRGPERTPPCLCVPFAALPDSQVWGVHANAFWEV